MRERVLPQARRRAAPRVAERERERPDDDRSHDPEAVGQRPIRMLPTPKPSIVSVYGSEHRPRATPNSACTAGSATTTDHMPTPPIVDSSSATTSRNHA